MLLENGKFLYLLTAIMSKMYFRKITAVEKACWKQNWRLQNNLKADDDLVKTWELSGLLVKSFPDFKRSIWL